MTSCAGAAAYGTQIYGAAGSQQAISGSNVIQMNGGRKSRGRRSRRRRGGNVLSDLALPATLMYANHTYGKRKNLNMTSSNRKKSRKNRSRSSRRTYRR